jgi:hypothetical protein
VARLRAFRKIGKDDYPPASVSPNETEYVFVLPMDNFQLIAGEHIVGFA